MIDPNARVMTQAEADAWFAAAAQRRADRLARKARREAVAPRGPTGTDTLAALAVGQTHTFPKYRSTSQTSSMLKNAYIKTGFRFTSALARDLMDGETVIGVTVRRTE